MKLGLGFLTVALIVAGCGDAGLDDGISDETDSLISPPDEPAGSNVALGDPCVNSSDCQSGLCSAPWDGEATPLVCVDSCVQTGDSTRWCADDAVCCEPDAFCGSRGLCESPVAADGTGAETGASSGTGVTGGSGTGGSGTGGSGTGATGGSGGSGSSGATGTGASSGTGGSTAGSSTG